MYSNLSVRNLSKAKHTISANSTQTINFLGAEPNYYRITNGSNSDLFLGVSMMPTKDFFDMKIPASSTKLFVDAFGHENIYMFNPSTENVNIIVTSFEAEFNPTVLALADYGADFSNIEINANSVITTFETSLPTGNNKIGSVDVNNLNSELKKIFYNGDVNYINKLWSYINSMNNRDIDTNNQVNSISSMLTGYNDSKISSIDERLSEANSYLMGLPTDIVIGLESKLDEIILAITNSGSKKKSINSKSVYYAWNEDTSLSAEYTSNCMKITAPEGYYFSYIPSINSTRRVYVVDNETAPFSIPVEDFNNMNIKATELVIYQPSSAVDIDCIVTEI